MDAPQKRSVDPKSRYVQGRVCSNLHFCCCDKYLGQKALGKVSAQVYRRACTMDAHTSALAPHMRLHHTHTHAHTHAHEPCMHAHMRLNHSSTHVHIYPLTHPLTHMCLLHACIHASPHIHAHTAMDTPTHAQSLHFKSNKSIFLSQIRMAMALEPILNFPKIQHSSVEAASWSSYRNRTQEVINQGIFKMCGWKH